nr:hypothetical protein TDPV-224 [Oriental turtle dovepox virus]
MHKHEDVKYSSFIFFTNLFNRLMPLELKKTSNPRYRFRFIYFLLS